MQKEKELNKTNDSKYDDDFEKQQLESNGGILVTISDVRKDSAQRRKCRIDEPDNMESSEFWLRKKKIVTGSSTYNTRSA